MNQLPLIVISFYDQRPVEPLVALLDSLDLHAAGRDYQRVISVNSEGGSPLPSGIINRVDDLLVGANAGMNIGAWDRAWRHWPERPYYLFLQDECVAVRPGWLTAFELALATPGTGMVGECFNPTWDALWDELRSGPGQTRLPGHELHGGPANRVDVYLDALQRFGIEAGPVARHLRSLIWAIPGPVLERIGGFPSGRNYGECIAAEIGVSRAIEAAGLSLVQVGSTPFQWFRHLEWNQSVPGGPFTHGVILPRDLMACRKGAGTGLRSANHLTGQWLDRLLHRTADLLRNSK